MSEHSFSEVTEHGWLGRITESLKSVVVGIILFIVAFPVLWWNEGNSVETYKSLKEGATSVVSIAADKVDEANDGKLVHMSGDAETTDRLQDPTFLVEENAIRLSRNVEMYQWTERQESKKNKKVGGKEETVTTYTYAKEWKNSAVSSSSFKKPEGHENPGSMPYADDSWIAGKVTLGAFELSDDLKGAISKSETVRYTAQLHDRLPPPLKSKSQVYGEALYIGSNPGSPEVGDVRITFTKVPQGKVSLFSQQSGNTFQPYQTKAGKALERLQMGTVSAAQMFEQAQQENVVFTWILRIIGFILMFAGVSMVFRPIAVVADVVPIVGDILRMGFGIVAFAVAAPLTLVTIAIAWLVYRPVLGVALLLIASGIIVGIKMLATKRKKAAAPASAY
ncbi:MAG: hypothetical protein A2289_05165 [Deltaproteobacteria bacterium RIFOXYA12_FULL_58_15]|nr:MAG: hypothetical protein A2289_05165 [Deltaproteobacteria bacterium RIFOXYA12_FULL_58_15]OGR08566.1 MAG: hypothetical protein A2341_25500 [Deltaproteobacteria bacterium RIFOXYB12_FULL_58_9]